VSEIRDLFVFHLFSHHSTAEPRPILKINFHVRPFGPGFGIASFELAKN
jgi:hypothetical protein